MIQEEAKIEFARLADAGEIGRLSRDEIEHGLGWKYTAPQIVRLIGDKTRNVVVARNRTGLAGFGIMSYRQDQANLDLLAVTRSCRRMKTGTRIVLWLEKVALVGGVSNVFVQVRESNTGAIAFYDNLGYKRMQTMRGYYQGTENGVVMAKALRQMFGAT